MLDLCSVTSFASNSNINAKLDDKSDHMVHITKNHQHSIGSKLLAHKFRVVELWLCQTVTKLHHSLDYIHLHVFINRDLKQVVWVHICITFRETYPCLSLTVYVICNMLQIALDTLHDKHGEQVVKQAGKCRSICSWIMSEA